MPADCQGHCPGQALPGPHGAPAEPGPLLLCLVLLRLLWLHTPGWPRLPSQGHPPASVAPAPTPLQPPPPVLPTRFPAAPAPLLQWLQESGVDSVPTPHPCCSPLQEPGVDSVPRPPPRRCCPRRAGWGGGGAAAPSNPNRPLARCSPCPGTRHCWSLITIVLERASQSRAPGFAPPHHASLRPLSTPAPNLDIAPHSPGARHGKARAGLLFLLLPLWPLGPRIEESRS